MRAKLFFAWYDMWVGAYWSSEKRALFVCLIPMLVLEILFSPKEYLSKVGFVMGIDTAEGKDRTIITDWIPCLKCGAWIIMDEDTPPKHRLCDDCLPFSLDKKEV